MNDKDLQRFMDKVIPDPNSGCWLWLACVQKKKGYSKFSLGGRDYLAHRVAYEHYVGKIPKALQLDHTCRLRCCVNPRHLEPVSNRVNSARSPLHASSQTHCIRGHELTDDNVYRYTVKNGKWFVDRRICKACAKIRKMGYRSVAAPSELSL